MKKLLWFIIGFVSMMSLQVLADGTLRGNINDYYKTINKAIPFQSEVCYQTATSAGEPIAGAIVGGIIGGAIGNEVGDDSLGDFGAILGALIGFETEKEKVAGVQTVCQMETYYDYQKVSVYDYSVASFKYDGQYYELRFQKKRFHRSDS